MPKKETFTSRFEETRGGRVPQKSKIWGDVFYGWSLTLISAYYATSFKMTAINQFGLLIYPQTFLARGNVITSHCK